MTQAFTAHCLTVHNPFHPMRGRESQILEEPVAIRALVPQTNQPVVVVRNGDYVLRADWDQEVNDGDTLAIVFLPQGGNDGGSDVLKVVLMIVVAYFAWYVGAPVAQGGLGYGGFAQAAVGIVGSPSINIHLEATQ